MLVDGRASAVRSHEGWMEGSHPTGEPRFVTFSLSHLKSVAFRNEVSIEETSKASQITEQSMAGGQEKSVVRADSAWPGRRQDATSGLRGSVFIPQWRVFRRCCVTMAGGVKGSFPNSFGSELVPLHQ